MLMSDKTYNGWKNYQTWNVALWIQNDEGLYNIAKECDDYGDFLDQSMGVRTGATPDGVMWNDPRLDMLELDSIFEEL